MVMLWYIVMVLVKTMENQVPELELEFGLGTIIHCKKSFEFVLFFCTVMFSFKGMYHNQSLVGQQITLPKFKRVLLQPQQLKKMVTIHCVGFQMIFNNYFRCRIYKS